MAAAGEHGKIQETDSRRPTMSKPVATTERAAVGDLLVIAGHRVGEAERIAEILAITGEPHHERYRVRWDDGHETTIYPGSDAIVRRRSTKEES
jgi:hypothetical protein